MKKNIVITGGELMNKGAQSMTFNVINRLKEIYPNKNIILLSSLDDKRIKKEGNPYTFATAPYRLVVFLNLLFGKKFYRKGNVVEQSEELDNILQDTFLNIDISGFRLSSQFNAPTSDITYLVTRKVMDNYNIKQYVFPQSFGPFDYSKPWGAIIKPMLKWMQLPELVYSREDQGYDYLKQYTQKNLKRSYDSVLYSKEYNLENIFKDTLNKTEFNVPENSVGIVPNSKLIAQNQGNDILSLYKDIIEEILNNGNEVYIFRHSIEDLDFCKQIKAEFANNDKVHLITEDLYCFELQDLIGQFKYIVGSRYHSIVHAYMFDVPSLIIGWSFKYKEIAQKFGQEELIYDIRSQITKEDIVQSINYLETNRESLKTNISNKMKEIRQEDIFDILL